MSRKNKIETEKELLIISDAYIQGKTQIQIAHELGMNQSTISRKLKKIREQWKENRLQNIDAFKDRELARIDRLELEYWEAWIRSCTTRTEKSIKKKEGKGVEKESSLKTYERDGNPSYLEGVERCIKLRMELLGLNEPIKLNVAGDKGKPIPVLCLSGDASMDDI